MGFTTKGTKSTKAHEGMSEYVDRNEERYFSHGIPINHGNIMTSDEPRPPAYTIRTEHLVIRCWSPEDAPLLADAVAKSLDHLLPWLPWAASEPEDLQTKIDRLRTFRGEFDLETNFIYGAFDPDETEVVGGTGLHPRIGSRGREIGYWVHVDHCNKGYATEMAAAMTRVGFELHDLHRIEIRCVPANVRSAAVPKKLGYQLEGTLRGAIIHPPDERHDAMIWGMLSDDYPSSPAADLPIEAYDVIGRRLL